MAVLVADKKRWEKAIEKCKAEKPRVTPLPEFGKYQVCGSKGDCYIVTWTGKGQEMKAECTCKAGLKNTPCYHIPATSGAFKLAVQQRASARLEANFAASVCGECGGLRGSELADDDHRTCTCPDYIGQPASALVAPVAETPSNVAPSLPFLCQECKTTPVADHGRLCIPCAEKISTELFG